MMDAEDKSLFAQAMQDVEPLKVKTPKYHATKDHKQQQHQDLRKVKSKYKHLARQAKKVAKHNPAQVVTQVSAFESLFFQQKGLRLQDFTKLKKSEFVLDACLDLHGETYESAQIQLLAFINECLHHKCRFVRIIHGKGYNSDDTYPVLKNLCNQLLRQNRQILGFCSAPEKDGGVGALNVLLKN